MRVLLTRPNSPMAVAPAPVGLGFLAQALKTRRGDQVKIVDGRRYRLSTSDLLAEAERFGPDAIGVSALTFEAPEALELITALKQRWPATPVILGGPHATGFGPALLERCRADYLVLGEGEETICELLDALAGKPNLAEVKGVARREGGEIIFSGARPPLSDLAGLAADWDAICPEDYFSSFRRNAMNTIAVSSRRLPVFFSRGCPYGCAYCHHIFGRQYRPFPIAETVAQMVALRDRYRLGEFEIIDDTFNLKLEHAKAVLREIIARKLDTALAFTNGLRADRMDEELLELMVRAGVYRIDYAIESASPRLQKELHKNLDLEKARQVVNLTAAKRIVTGAYYMFGFPGETEAEMSATLEYALSLENHIASFFFLMPFPGTEIAEADPERSRRVRELNFRDASGIVLNLSAASDQFLQRIVKTGYRKFYFSGPRILRIARDVPKNLRLAASALAVIELSFKAAVNY